jgi:hypothetical protein
MAFHGGSIRALRASCRELIHRSIELLGETQWLQSSAHQATTRLFMKLAQITVVDEEV